MNVIAFRERRVSPQISAKTALAATANKVEQLKTAVATALEDQDMDLLLLSLRGLCAIYGVITVANELGVERTNLYRMLRDGSNPKIGNVLRMLDLFQIRVTAKAQLAGDDRPLAAGSTVATGPGL
jgi:DNA-binding phage protein